MVSRLPGRRMLSSIQPPIHMGVGELNPPTCEAIVCGFESHHPYCERKLTLVFTLVFFFIL